MALATGEERGTLMTEWSVAVHGMSQSRITDDQLFMVLEDLDPYAAVASVSRDRRSLTIRLNVQADNVEAAVHEATSLVGKAVPLEGVSAIEIATVEELQRELDQPSLPEIVGVAEVASILDVSKQRASSLARAKAFPRPVAVLASGPVWLKGTIQAFQGSWQRRPGRPAVRVKVS